MLDQMQNTEHGWNDARNVLVKSLTLETIRGLS